MFSTSPQILFRKTPLLTRKVVWQKMVTENRNDYIWFASGN